MKDEISKAPLFDGDLFYTLIVWSLALSPQVTTSLQGSASLVCSCGSFNFPTGMNDEKLNVPRKMELVVINPDNLGELLGPKALIIFLDSRRSEASISSVSSEWISTGPF